MFTIFGAGSIGSLFAGKMAYSGFDLSVVGRTPHVNEIRKNGLKIIEDQIELISYFSADTDLQPRFNSQDPILITTKAYDNGIVTNNLAEKVSKQTPIFICQNGMGNEEIFKQTFSENPIYRAITTEAAELIQPGIVKHIASGKTYFNVISGIENGIGSKICNMLNKSGFQARKTPKIKLIMWQKLLTNAAICPLGALLHVPNGRILEKPSILRIFNAILEEGLTIARLNMPDEDFSETKSFVMNVIEKTKDNRCSMLQDIERGRRTEIDFINGFIVQESKRLGLKAPINAAIADLVRHLERYP